MWHCEVWQKLNAKVCGGQCGTGTGPFFNTSSLPCTIPPMTLTPVHLYYTSVASVRQTQMSHSHFGGQPTATRQQETPTQNSVSRMHRWYITNTTNWDFHGNYVNERALPAVSPGTSRLVTKITSKARQGKSCTKSGRRYFGGRGGGSKSQS
jgi:hypothetical protein